MQEKVQKLEQAFRGALKNKEKKAYGKKDREAIYEAAKDLFDGEAYLSEQQINTLKDLWVQLAEGHIDKSQASKKLHGTSRAEAIKAVLERAAEADK